MVTQLVSRLFQMNTPRHAPRRPEVNQEDWNIQQLFIIYFFIIPITLLAICVDKQ